jgi:hypothetical protein
MPDIGVRISADAIEFINAIKRVEKQTEDFRKSFETKMESIGSLAKKALGAFVAFQGLAGLREFTNSVDAIIKSSRALGESAEAFANIAAKRAWQASAQKCCRRDCTGFSEHWQMRNLGAARRLMR